MLDAHLPIRFLLYGRRLERLYGARTERSHHQRRLNIWMKKMIVYDPLSALKY